VDSVMDKEVRGSAKTEGSETVVSLEKPEKQEFALEKTQFPTQHLRELLDNARKGETFYETTLFDGSEDADRIMTTTVIIGKGSTPAANDPERKAIKTLADDEFWPVDIAYFDLKGDQGEEIPTYRISFKLHESGITRDLVMDYGDFSMTGTLVDLALFEPAKDCAQ